MLWITADPDSIRQRDGSLTKRGKTVYNRQKSELI